SKYSDMFKEFESGGASGSDGCGDDEESDDDEEGEDEDGDDERDRFPQRHVAGERPDISLGKDPIVVVDTLETKAC
ncbi:hypothetical protein Tco_0778579, partial [Tanacetum coccineum]